jgi:hypothetical protein
VESPASTELEDSSSELLESRLLEDCGLDSEDATLLEETPGFSPEEYCSFSLEEERSTPLEKSRAEHDEESNVLDEERPEPEVSESASLEEYASSA